MSASALDVVVLLATAKEAVTTAVEAQLASFHGLGLDDFLLLTQLVDGPRTTVELAALTGHKPANVARMLGPLEHGGEIHRHEGTVTLTDAGRQLVEDARGTAEHVAKQVLFQPPGGSPLTTADRDTLAALLTKLGGRGHS